VTPRLPSIPVIMVTKITIPNASRNEDARERDQAGLGKTETVTAGDRAGFRLAAFGALLIVVLFGMGQVFGVPGILVATPLLAVAIVIVRRVYVERLLEGHEADAKPPRT